MTTPTPVANTRAQSAQPGGPFGREVFRRRASLRLPDVRGLSEPFLSQRHLTWQITGGPWERERKVVIIIGGVDPGQCKARFDVSPREVAPCAACHGPGGYKLGAPALQRQQADYIEEQLTAFAQGLRQNDIFEQMRIIAKQLTPEEIHALAAFYAAGVGAPSAEGSASR